MWIPLRIKEAVELGRHRRRIKQIDRACEPHLLKSYRIPEERSAMGGIWARPLNAKHPAILVRRRALMRAGFGHGSRPCRVLLPE